MKKFLSLALVTAMLLSVVSLGAMAETGVNTNALEKKRRPVQRHCQNRLRHV